MTARVSPQEAARELLARKEAQESFLGFSRYMMDEDQQPQTHHQLIANALDKVEKGEITRLMILMPPGSAKALALDTPIPTPTGWTTMGNLAVGDQVFDEQGKPCRITWVSPVWRDRPVYEVLTDCGDKIVADQDHEWLVRLCGKHPVEKIKTTEYLCRTRSKRPMISRAKALELPEQELPIDPYLLGVWLGDGHSSGGRITSGDEDRPWMRTELERRGIETACQSGKMAFGFLGQRAKFRELGLLNDPYHNVNGAKHIPEQYLRASYQQRLELLQGLIDTDGTVCKSRGCTTFCNTNLVLALQVRELVRSMGVKAGWSESRAMLNGKDCGPAYKVSFYLKDSALMPRKRELTRDQYRTPNTYIEVTPAGYADTMCIEVDSPSHLFLCGRSMTPTHNSTYGSGLFPSYFLGKNPKSSVIATSHTTAFAEKWGRRVRNMVQDPKYTNVFPIGVASDSAAAGQWGTTEGGEYFAVGAGARVQGRRSDLLVMDDVIGSREDAESDLILTRIWDWWKFDLSPRLKPGARVVLINTRYAMGDIAGRLLESEPEKWTVLKLRMEAVEGEEDPLGRQPGERLWKEWFTQEMVEDAKQDPRTWTSLYQQSPAPIGGGELKKSWVQYYDNADFSRMNKIMLVDPAGGRKDKKSDYTAIWVIGLGDDDNMYVCDMVRDRLDMAERTEMIFKLHRKWKPMQTRVERYGLMADVENLRAEQNRRNYRFQLLEVGGATKKADRIRRLIPYFRAGRVWFPREFHYTDYTGRMRDLVHDFVEEELTTFPVGSFDDMLDSLARIAEPKLDLPWPRQNDWSTMPVLNFGILDEVVGY